MEPAEYCGVKMPFDYHNDFRTHDIPKGISENLDDDCLPIQRLQGVYEMLIVLKNQSFRVMLLLTQIFLSTGFSDNAISAQ